MDVYSCRDFEPVLIEQHLAKSLGAYDVQMTDLSFSLEYERAKVRSPARSTPKLSGRDGLRGWSSKRAAGPQRPTAAAEEASAGPAIAERLRPSRLAT